MIIACKGCKFNHQFLTMSINNTKYEYINPIQGGPFGRFKSEEGSIYEVHFGLPKSFWGVKTYSTKGEVIFTF